MDHNNSMKATSEIIVSMVLGELSVLMEIIMLAISAILNLMDKAKCTRKWKIKHIKECLKEANLLI